MTSLSRRQEYRQTTIEEIKALARRQLAEHGAGALSLRAIAREMRMASSALYRYFASYDDLIGALCVDAYDSVADAVTAARNDRPADDHAGRWLAVCHAYRRWALDQPADFALIFGTPVPGFQASAQVTGLAAGRFAAVMIDTIAAAAEAGALDPDQVQIPEDLAVGPVEQLMPEATTRQPPRLVGITISAWVAVLGYLNAEVFGSLATLIADTDRLFDSYVHTVMLGMGFTPEHVQAATTGR